MKPFKQCPGCQESLVENTINKLIYERCPKYCKLEYRQHFETSINDDLLSYISFYTENFFVYSYFKQMHTIPANEAHIYHRIFPRGETCQSPMIKLKNLIIDFNQLEKLDRKLKLYATFL